MIIYKWVGGDDEVEYISENADPRYRRVYVGTREDGDLIFELDKEYRLDEHWLEVLWPLCLSDAEICVFLAELNNVSVTEIELVEATGEDIAKWFEAVLPHSQ